MGEPVMSSETGFVLQIDGRRVHVDQAKQQVTLLDERGAVEFRERIQVAAGSLQGLFSAVDSISTVMGPETKA